jgi:PAS domain S-box-containing protein
MDDTNANKNQPITNESHLQEGAPFFEDTTYDSLLFNALVTNNHSIIFIVEPSTGKIINANKAACKFYGYSYNEFIGMNLNNINILSLEEIKVELIAAQKGERNYFNFKHKLKNGEIRHVEVYSSPIILNKIEYLYSIIHDVTDRVQAEALNKMLKHSLDVYTDGIYWMDSDNKFVYVNEAGGKAFGCKPEDLLGKSLYDVNPTTTPESLADLWNKLRTDGIFTAETVHRRFDGSEFYVEIRTVYFQYEGKEYNCGYARDITERKKTELELISAKERAEESQEKYRLLIDNINDLVCEIDENGFYTYVCPHYIEILGYESVELIGKSATDLIHPEDLIKSIEKYEELKNGGNRSIDVWRFRHKNGQYRILECKGSIYKNSKNEQHAVVVSRDITEQVQASLELQKAKERAEESDRLKTAFIQNMSHEIRTPMNAIMGFSDLLVKNYHNKPKLEHFASIIDQRCNDLLDIINDILDISKIESGQLPVNIENCDLDNLFAELKTFFTEQQTRMNKKHISFDIINNYDVEDATISTDKVKLRQI